MHGGALAHLGRLAEARTELERARSDYEAHADPHPFILDAGGHTLCERAEVLAVMGYPDQAVRSSQEALALARRLDTPYNITFALFYCSVIRRRRGEAIEALHSADAAIEQAVRHEFLDALSWSQGLRSWALCRSGRIAEGVSGISDALASTRLMGPNVARAPLLAILADAYLSAGRAEDGLAAVEEATGADCLRGEKFCRSELHFLRGDLLMLSGAGPLRRKAEACYLDAITVARSQGARWFELLATTRLCRLRREAGIRRRPSRALSALYNSFTEGRTTSALSDARTLIEAVG